MGRDMVITLRGRIFGTPDPELWAYYRRMLRASYATGIQYAFRYW